MDFVVNRKDLHQCRVDDTAPPEPKAGQALLEIGAFGMTSNNITYAVLGDAMSYWDHFPADRGWGRVPVWGFAEVSASAHDELAEGTRVFGYLPPSTHLLVEPDRIDERGFIDAAPHRAKLPSAYRGYRRNGADPVYRADREDEQILFWPLFYTAFLIDDLLADGDFFGAGTMVLSSASSKLALATAFLMAQREEVEVIGLTSPRNADFVRGVGIYGEVVTYDEIGSLPKSGAVYVDFSGDAGVRAAVHRHYGSALAYDCAAGFTHREESARGSENLQGPKPTFFFGQDRIRQRGRDWGTAGLEARVNDAWHPFVDWSAGWLEVQHGYGPEAVERAYLEVLDGRVGPSTGYVLSVWPKVPAGHGAPS